MRGANKTVTQVKVFFFFTFFGTRRRTGKQRIREIPVWYDRIASFREPLPTVFRVFLQKKLSNFAFFPKTVPSAISVSSGVPSARLASGLDFVPRTYSTSLTL